MNSIDLVKIIGNLIDNALDEAASSSANERWIELHGRVENKSLIMTICNPGVIPMEHMRCLFQVGFSTKDKTSHNGIGLSIVKDTIDYYNGKINVTSNHELGTSFRIEVPTYNI